MAELRLGRCNKGLYQDYKTESFEYRDMDIEVRLENGDVVELCTRKKGYALRIKEKGKPQKTLKDVDF